MEPIPRCDVCDDYTSKSSSPHKRFTIINQATQQAAVGQEQMHSDAPQQNSGGAKPLEPRGLKPVIDAQPILSNNDNGSQQNLGPSDDVE